MLRLLGTLMVGLAAVAILGCGGGKKLDTVPVSGTVTLDGTPVEGAMVVFTPTTGGGAAASGKTDASGRYKLTTRDPNDGALAGTYLVIIHKTEVKDPTAGAVKPGMTGEEAAKAAIEAYEKSGKPEVKAIDHLPKKYKDPGTSGFKVEVTKGGKNEFDFPLTSK
ncbi:MAG: carboxypeptidase-like regulatory domain-containing protein [Thermoguttaceae bacterium]|nr:carboxypeptidase-like regulatory domain-containing protein [Thermoguttaceae bacterium]